MLPTLRQRTARRYLVILATVGLICYLCLYRPISWHLAVNRRNTSHHAGEVWERQTARLQRLATQCSRLPAAARTPKPHWEEFIVDDRLRYIYCKVEKVACTTWKRVLLALTGNITTREALKMDFFQIHYDPFYFKHLKRLSSYSAAEISYRLKNYFKFVFVRQPMERLVSAYRDKFFTRDEPEFKKLVRRVRRAYHEHGKKTSISALISHIGSQVRRSHELNIHWRPQSQISRPCYVHYDFIGHYETLEIDANAVLHQLRSRARARAQASPTGAPNQTPLGLFTWPHFDPDYGQKDQGKSRQLAETLYRSVDVAAVNWLQNRLYRDDYLLFGYTPHNYTRT